MAGEGETDSRDVEVDIPLPKDTAGELIRGQPASELAADESPSIDTLAEEPSRIVRAEDMAIMDPRYDDLVMRAARLVRGYQKIPRGAEENGHILIAYEPEDLIKTAQHVRDRLGDSLVLRNFLQGRHGFMHMFKNLFLAYVVYDRNYLPKPKEQPIYKSERDLLIADVNGFRLANYLERPPKPMPMLTEISDGERDALSLEALTLATDVVQNRRVWRITFESRKIRRKTVREFEGAYEHLLELCRRADLVIPELTHTYDQLAKGAQHFLESGK